MGFKLIQLKWIQHIPSYKKIIQKAPSLFISVLLILGVQRPGLEALYLKSSDRLLR